MTRLSLIVLGLFVLLTSYTVRDAPKEKLSDYNFFTGTLSDLRPASGVIPYSLNTPLFSNYSEKLRFVKIPEGTAATFNDTAVFDFPEGTILIKNFYYPADFRKPAKNRRILETRLLINGGGGWEALPYIWNDEQTEAYYDPAGETKLITFINSAGKKINTPYVIPNKNQCKSCHIRDQKLLPIGPSARQLNKLHAYTGETAQQLLHWQKSGLIKNVPDVSAISTLAVWDDPSTGNTERRARAYLDANCGHCHSRGGPANTSGLFLDIFEKDAPHLGVNKSPVAAGRGAGDLQFDIVPGHPDQSILVFRMKTNDPAIAMPEVGREQVHTEGVALIEAWIKQLPTTP